MVFQNKSNKSQPIKPSFHNFIASYNSIYLPLISLSAKIVLLINQVEYAPLEKKIVSSDSTGGNILLLLSEPGTLL
jgi:hypothetical protein